MSTLEYFSSYLMNNNTSNDWLLQIKDNKIHHVDLHEKNNLIENYIIEIIESKFPWISLLKENILIDFWVENMTEEHIYHPSRGNNSLIYSFVLCISENPTYSFIGTNIDFETYKYKEFSEECELMIFHLKKNKVICSNGNFFQGFIQTNKDLIKLDTFVSDTYLFINIFDKNPKKDKNIQEKKMDIKNNENIDFHKNIIDNSILNAGFFDEILYQKSYNIFEDLFKQIQDSKKKNTQDDIYVKSKIFPIENETFYKNLERKYDESFAKNIHEIFMEKEIKINNYFSEKKITKNIFTKEICKWMIQECEYFSKQNGNQTWIKSPENNDIFHFNLEIYQPIFNFVIISLEQIGDQINTLYSLKNIKLNFKEISIIKYDSKKQNQLQLCNTNKKYFFYFNILLSEKENENDVIYYKDEDNDYFIEIGDLFIGCCKIKDTLIEMNKSKKYTKYLLSGYVDIEF